MVKTLLIKGGALIIGMLIVDKITEKRSKKADDKVVETKELTVNHEG